MRTLSVFESTRMFRPHICTSILRLAALQAAVSGHDTMGDWDGSGYCVWEDIVSAAATILRGGA